MYFKRDMSNLFIDMSSVSIYLIHSPVDISKEREDNCLEKE